MIKKENGITLIALIITIIVLLILAGVAISAVTNDNGVMKKSSDAVSKTNIAAVKEEMEVALAEWKADYYEENISLEGRSATTASGATVSYEEEGIVYISKKGNVYIGILDNGRIDKVNLVGAESSEEGDGVSLTDYEWTAKVPKDNWFAKDYYYNFEWEGEGTKESPYLIKTVKDLAGLSYKVASGETYNNSTYFKLTKDLNMKNHIWVPIGGHSLDNVSEDGKYYAYDSNKFFNGNFDGNGYSISGLYYNNVDDSYGDYVGVFGRIKSANSIKIEIKNLKVLDSYLNCRNYLGVISGYSSFCNIKECYGDTVLIGNRIVGGIVGNASDMNVDNCAFDGKISTIGKEVYHGGICGYIYYSHVSNSLFGGSISGEYTR